jgi:outer membrane biosynthesis protein TonB
MMSSDEPPTRLRTAIALSITGHLCALWLLVSIIDAPPLGAPDAPEGTPALFVTTIVRAREARPPGLHPQGGQAKPAPPPRLRAAPLALATPRPRQIARAPRKQIRVAQATAAPSEDRPRQLGRSGGADGRTAALPGTKLASNGAVNHAIIALPHISLALAPPSPAALATAPAAPTAQPALNTPAPPPVPSPSATARTVEAASFGGLFSQNYPPALAAPTELAQIRSRLRGPIRIRIDIDETGRATDVRFVRALPDAALEDEIRSQLLALHYIPADCNGLHCEGTLEIAY